MIDLEPQYLELIANILKKCLPPEAKVYFFGSRTTGQAKRFSDIDLLIDTGKPMTLEHLSLLNTTFDASLLPYKVDVVDAHTLSDGFYKAIIDQLHPCTFQL